MPTATNSIKILLLLAIIILAGWFIVSNASKNRSAQPSTASVVGDTTPTVATVTSPQPNINIVEVFEPFSCPAVYNQGYVDWQKKVAAQPNTLIIKQPLNLAHVIVGVSGGTGRWNDYLAAVSSPITKINGTKMFWDSISADQITPAISDVRQTVTYTADTTNVTIKATVSSTKGLSKGNKFVFAMVDNGQYANTIRKYMHSDYYNQTSQEWEHYLDIPALSPNEAYTVTLTEPIDKIMNGFTWSDTFKIVSMVQDFTCVNDAGQPNKPETQHWCYDRPITSAVVAEKVATQSPASTTNPPVTESNSLTVAVPTNVKVASVANKTAIISWDSILGLKYRVQYRKIGDAVWITERAGEHAQRKIGVSIPLVQGVNYEAQVQSFTTTAKSEYSASVLFKTTGTAPAITAIIPPTAPTPTIPTQPMNTSVTITSPSNGTVITHGTAATITATAPAQTTSVKFSRTNAYGTNTVGYDSSAPFTYTWNTGSFAGGAYSFFVDAYDASGALIGTSSKINVALQ